MWPVFKGFNSSDIAAEDGAAKPKLVIFQTRSPFVSLVYNTTIRLGLD
jgi:hypothetical protein